MSGICGVCAPGRTLAAKDIQEMIAGLSTGSSELASSTAGNSFALGCSRLFPGQEIASLGGVQVVVDADLLNLDSLQSLIHGRYPQAPSGVAGTIAALYSIYGDDCVSKLDGAFSFALWDARGRRLLFAIDRLGIKNLYWRHVNGKLAFASRLTPLRYFDPAMRVNEASVPLFMLFSAIPAPLTIYEGTEKLEPGHQLVFEDGEVRQRQYWDLDFHEEVRSEKEWAELVRQELRASVHRHLAGCQPQETGAFLSGGTDSSTVVAFMTERQKPVRTFSIVFNEASHSEANFVQTTVQAFQAEQHNCCLSPKDALDSLPRIAAHYDEPLANSSVIAAYFCGVMARDCGVNTLLGGDGGDELFGGNSRYQTDKYFALYHRVPGPLRRMLIEPVLGMLPKEHRWLGLPYRYTRRASIPNPRRFFSRNFFLTFPAEEIFEPEILEQAPTDSWLDIPEQHFAAPIAKSELNRLLYLDVKMALADNDLKKVSGMAELAGVRVRYPLLDYRLAELAARVPAKLKLRRFEKRYIFKRAMSGILPDKVLYKKKHGMGVPVSSWLLNEPQLRKFALDVLHDPRTRSRGYFRQGFVDRLMKLQQEHVAFYGEILWYLLTLELWHRNHFDPVSRAACAD